MRVRVSYNYNNYPGYPKATAYARFRAAHRRMHWLLFMLYSGIPLGLMMAVSMNGKDSEGMYAAMMGLTLLAGEDIYRIINLFCRYRIESIIRKDHPHFRYTDPVNMASMRGNKPSVLLKIFLWIAALYGFHSLLTLIPPLMFHWSIPALLRYALTAVLGGGIALCLCRFHERRPSDYDLTCTLRSAGFAMLVLPGTLLILLTTSLMG